MNECVHNAVVHNHKHSCSMPLSLGAYMYMYSIKHRRNYSYNIDVSKNKFLWKGNSAVAQKCQETLDSKNNKVYKKGFKVKQ